MLRKDEFDDSALLIIFETLNVELLAWQVLVSAVIGDLPEHQILNSWQREATTLADRQYD
jgi:hypothetical protein